MKPNPPSKKKISKKKKRISLQEMMSTTIMFNRVFCKYNIGCASCKRDCVNKELIKQAMKERLRKLRKGI